jgi:hemolysin activation/secretion protein
MAAILLGLLPLAGVGPAWAGVAAPAAAPLAAAAAAAPAKPSALPPETAFELNEIRVDGNTVLPAEQVEALIYPYLGPGKSSADVTAARHALEAAYKNAGYVTVTVGPGRWLDHASGVIGIAITERPVGRLRVMHARYFVPDAIRAGAPSVAPGKVPNYNGIKADLLGLNALPDRSVTPSLRPGRIPGTVDVDLDVDDKFPLHGTVEVNNRYNAFTHAERVLGSLTYDNFFQRGDSATISYSVAPEDVRDSEIASASYLFHIPDSQMSLLFSYLHSNSNIIALGTTDVAGRGDTAGFRLLVPLGTTADGAGNSFTHSFSVGWDYKKYYELDTYTTSKTLQSAPITFYPLNAAYALNWTGPRSTTDVNLSAELGLSRLGTGDTIITAGPSAGETYFDNKRYNAPTGFSMFRANITRTQELPYGMQAWGSLTGQITNDPLVSSEQLGLGGVDSVRGYLESESLGDYGAVLQSELRSPDLKTYVKGPVTSWRFHVFADTGIVALRDPEPGQRNGDGLSSAGVGTRVNLWGYLNGAVQDATAFNRGPNTKPGTNRVLFRVYGEF